MLQDVLFPDVDAHQCLCDISVSLLSPVWSTRRKSGRKSGTSCWSWPPASPGSITAPTEPTGEDATITPPASPSRVFVHEQSARSGPRVQASALTCSDTLTRQTLSYLQSRVLWWTGLRESGRVSRLCSGPRPQTAHRGGGRHHAEGLWRRRWIWEHLQTNRIIY